MQRDIQLLADLARVLQILGGRAVAVVVFPVGHVQGMHVGTRISQQECRHGRIDAARQAEDDLLIFADELHLHGIVAAGARTAPRGQFAIGRGGGGIGLL